MTLLPLLQDMTDFLPNQTLREEIQSWRQEHHLTDEESEEYFDSDSEDNDEDTLQALENAAQIFRRHHHERKSSAQQLVDFGNRMLKQREKKSMDKADHCRLPSLVGYFDFHQ